RFRRPRRAIHRSFSITLQRTPGRSPVLPYTTLFRSIAREAALQRNATIVHIRHERCVFYQPGGMPDTVATAEVHRLAKGIGTISLARRTRTRQVVHARVRTPRCMQPCQVAAVTSAQVEF